MGKQAARADSGSAHLSEIVTETNRLIEQHEFKSAFNKLVRDAESELSKSRHNNAAYLFLWSSKILSDSGIADERMVASELAERAALANEIMAYHNTREPQERAMYLSRAGLIYGRSADISDLEDSARCYKTAGIFYLEAARSPSIADERRKDYRILKTTPEDLKALAAQSFIFAALALQRAASTDKKIFSEIADLLERASDSYSEIGLKFRSAECMSGAIDSMRSAAPEDKDKLIDAIELIKKGIERHEAIEDLSKAVEYMRLQHLYTKRLGQMLQAERDSR